MRRNNGSVQLSLDHPEHVEKSRFQGTIEEAAASLFSPLIVRSFGEQVSTLN